MKLIVTPPLKIDEMNGARIRTAEIYSRLGQDAEVTFVLDETGMKRAEPHFKERLRGFYSLGAYAGWNPLRSLISLRKVVRKAKQTDLVVCYDSYKLSVAYSYIVTRLSRRPLVIIVHLVEDSTRNRGYFMRKAFEHCKGIMALDSKIMMEELRGMFPAKEIVPVTNGVDCTQFSEPSSPDGRTTDCLFVGVLSERKGEKYLLDSWKKVIEERPGSRLKILAGVTPTSKIESFMAAAKSNGVDGSISVLGYVSEEEKIDSYQRASIFVFPSNDEGFGMVISEALAAGMPAVLWDLPSFERFREGVVKVPYPDVALFSQSILELLSDENHRNNKGKEAREFARDHLSWDAAAKLELKALRKLSGVESETEGREPTGPA